MTCWLDTWLSLPSSQLFVRIDEDFLISPFNHYGLKSKITHFDIASKLLCCRLSSFPIPSKSITFKEIESQAIILYAHLHTRFLTTKAGIDLMFAKHPSFQICPRVLCRDTHCLPFGMSDEFGSTPAAMFCPSCGDLYRISIPELSTVDGAFFGSTWVHLFIQMHPEVVLKQALKVYVPKIFGFRIYNPNAPIATQDSSSDG